MSEPHSGDQVAGRPHERRGRRQLHRLGGLASHAWAGVIVALVALAWVLDGALTGFPSYWPAILQSVTAVVTVVMLFVIQHLQARDRTVMQRKLDEILRSLPNADNRVIAVEKPRRRTRGSNRPQPPRPPRLGTASGNVFMSVRATALATRHAHRSVVGHRACFGMPIRVPVTSPRTYSLPHLATLEARLSALRCPVHIGPRTVSSHT